MTYKFRLDFVLALRRYALALINSCSLGFRLRAISGGGELPDTTREPAGVAGFGGTVVSLLLCGVCSALVDMPNC